MGGPPFILATLGGVHFAPAHAPGRRHGTSCSLPASNNERTARPTGRAHTGTRAVAGDRRRIIAHRLELCKATRARRSGATGAVCAAGLLGGSTGQTKGRRRARGACVAAWKADASPALKNSEQHRRFQSGTAQAPPPA